MNGVLVIDKPQVLTSHDVVAAARRTLGETKIGHTGTLDPLATGRTATCDRPRHAAGAVLRRFRRTTRQRSGSVSPPIRTTSPAARSAVRMRYLRREDLVRALQALTGEYLQPPPAFSAKKMGGRRAYELARSAHAVALAPTAVRVARDDLVSFSGGRAHVVLTCSAGFYVRSFAHTLGELTGTGACLEALRRTRSGEFCLEKALGSQSSARRRVSHRPWFPCRRCCTIFRRSPSTHADWNESRTVVGSRRVIMSAARRRCRPKVGASDGCGGDLIGMGTPGSEPGSLHPAVVLM